MKAWITDTIYLDVNESLIIDVNTHKYIFSIYKIDNDKSLNDLMNHISFKFEENNSNVININNHGFFGFLFSNVSKPRWLNVITDLIPFYENFDLFNSNISFLLFKMISKNNKENIYVICGGIGYHFISIFIEKNFGLNLIPKIIDREDSFVKQVSENRLIGNNFFSARKNRNATNLRSESGYSNIFNQLELSVDNNIISKFGFNSNDLNSTNIITKHAIRISKSVSINQLSKIISNIDKLNDNEMKFPLNQFVLANKKGYKNDYIKKLFLDFILNKNSDYYDFEIIPGDLDYSSNISFTIECDDIENIISENTLDWHYLIDTLEKNNVFFSKKLLKSIFFNGNLIVDDGLNKSSFKLFDCLNGYLIDENSEETFYLMNGQWYIIDKSFEDINTEKFNEIFSYSKNYYLNNFGVQFPIFQNKVIEYKNNNDELPNESDYNEFFKNDSLVIYADKKPHKKVEIADLIVYDDIHEILYLICLKDKFASRGCRDLYGQIESSANSIQFKLRNMADNTLSMYYEDLVKNNEGNIVKKEEFKNYFNKNICYVAGFFKGFRENTESEYGKILSYQIRNKLKELGFDFIILDFSFNIYDM